MQAYSDPERASEPRALPDVEVYYVAQPGEACPACQGTEEPHDKDHEGWYYWFCFPGCLPDSEPIGPFPTMEEAIQDAQKDSEEEA